MFNTTYKKIGLVILLAITVYLVITYIGALVGLTLPLLLSLVIAYKMHPIIIRLEKALPLPRGVISLLSVMIAIGIVALVSYGIIEVIIRLVNQLNTILPAAIEELNAFYHTALASYHQYFNLVPKEWQGVAENSINSLVGQLASFVASLATSLVNSLTFLPNILFTFFFTLLTTYFVTRDFERVDAFKKRILDFLHSKVLYHEIKRNVFTVLVGYLKAQLILMTITFSISLVGLSILKVNYAPLIALFVALVDALPMLGPAAIYAPWILARGLVGNIPGAISLGILYAISTLTRQTLEPKIVSTQIGVHPIITLSAMYAGIKLFGVFGIILGPLSAMTIIKSYEILILAEKHEH
jgi:sporulation integral membrane protein YtvI